MDSTNKECTATKSSMSSSASVTVSSSEIPAKSASQKLSRRQYLTLFTLCFINFVNYMDRYTIAGVLTLIQCDYEISDAEGGLISTVFVLAYMLCAPFSGYLGDRYSRKALMSTGILLWGLATLAGSFMPNYWSFLVARIFVGIGEAFFSTVAPTLISDICVGDTRSNFLILFYFAIPVGSGLGFILGSTLANAFGDWRWALRYTPVLGIIGFILVIFVLQEPKRGQSEGSQLKATNYWADVKYLVKNKSYVASTIGVTLVTYVSGGLAWWGPKYFSLGIASSQGEENVDVDNVSFLFGVTATVAGVVGVWSGSYIGQKLRPRFPTADALVCAWGMIISAPLMYWGALMATGPQWATFTVITFAQWFMNLNWAPSGDMLLYVVIPPRRATAGALMVLTSHALGDAISPYLIGLVSDAFKVSLTANAQVGSYLSNSHSYQTPDFFDASSNATDCTSSGTINFDTLDVDYKALQYSMLITTIFEVVGAFFFFVTAWYLVDDRRKVDEAVAGALVDTELAISKSEGGDKHNSDIRIPRYSGNEQH